MQGETGPLVRVTARERMWLRDSREVRVPGVEDMNGRWIQIDVEQGGWFMYSDQRFFAIQTEKKA